MKLVHQKFIYFINIERVSSRVVLQNSLPSLWSAPRVSVTLDRDIISLTLFLYTHSFHLAFISLPGVMNLSSLVSWWIKDEKGKDVESWSICVFVYRNYASPQKALIKICHHAVSFSRVIKYITVFPVQMWLWLHHNWD